MLIIPRVDFRLVVYKEGHKLGIVDFYPSNSQMKRQTTLLNVDLDRKLNNSIKKIKFNLILIFFSKKNLFILFFFLKFFVNTRIFYTHKYSESEISKMNIIFLFTKTIRWILAQVNISFE